MNRKIKQSTAETVKNGSDERKKAKRMSEEGWLREAVSQHKKRVNVECLSC